MTTQASQNQKRTLSAFIKSANLPAPLIRAVVRQSGGWESFREHAPDVANHGAAGGFSGFIWYTETEAFTRKNKAAILAYAADLARDIGDGDEYQLIQGFGCLSKSGRHGADPEYSVGEIVHAIHGRGGNADDRTQIFNAVAWFALEETARAYCDWLESE